MKFFIVVSVLAGLGVASPLLARSADAAACSGNTSKCCCYALTGSCIPCMLSRGLRRLLLTGLDTNIGDCGIADVQYTCCPNCEKLLTGV